jgi:hypothetical protein
MVGQARLYPWIWAAGLAVANCFSYFDSDRDPLTSQVFREETVLSEWKGSYYCGDGTAANLTLVI